MRRRRNSWAWLLTLSAFAAYALPNAAMAQDDSTAVGLLELSLADHPALQSSYQQWLAVAQRERQARSWPDPILTFGYWITDMRSESGPGRVELMQPIPWFGTQSLAGEVEVQRQRRLRAELESEVLSLCAEGIASFNEYAYLARSVQVTRDIVEVLRYQERVALTRYETGSAQHPDVVRLQIERAEREDQLHRLGARRPAAAARLNAALGRHPELALPWPVDFQDDVGLEDGFREPAKLRSAILANSPQLRAVTHEMDRSQRQLALARREQYPTWMVGFETKFDQRMQPQDGGRTTWMAMITLNLPLWRGKYAGKIDESAANLRAVEHERDDVFRNLLVEAEEWLYRVEEAERRIELYRGTLIPKGQEALQSTSRLYQTGQVSVLDFLDSERSLLQFELDLARARADRNTALARLRQIIGLAPIDVDALLLAVSQRYDDQGGQS